MPNKKPIQGKIDHAKKQKHEAQADLRKVTELHKPKGTKATIRRLKGKLKRLVVKWTDRIAVLRKHRDKKRRDPLRKKIIAWWEWGVANEPQIHYLQSRPYPSDPKKLPTYIDCSASTTLSYKFAGAEDPNGYDFNGYGFTGTIRSHLPQIKIGDVKRGDPIVYGTGSGSHVVVAAEDANGRSDFKTYSHGQEAGPMVVLHSVENAAHGGYFTAHQGVI